MNYRQEISDRWKDLSGSSFHKTLELLRCYCGLELDGNDIATDFFSKIKTMRLFAHYTSQVTNAIKDYYGPQGFLVTKPEYCTVQHLLTKLKRELSTGSFSFEGELGAIIEHSAEVESIDYSRLLMVEIVNNFFVNHKVCIEPIKMPLCQVPFTMDTENYMEQSVKKSAQNAKKVLLQYQDPFTMNTENYMEQSFKKSAWNAKKVFLQFMSFFKGYQDPSSILGILPKEIFFLIFIFQFKLYKEDINKKYNDTFINVPNFPINLKKSEPFYGQGLFKRKELTIAVAGLNTNLLKLLQDDAGNDAEGKDSVNDSQNSI